MVSKGPPVSVDADDAVRFAKDAHPCASWHQSRLSRGASNRALERVANLLPASERPSAVASIVTSVLSVPPVWSLPTPSVHEEARSALPAVAQEMAALLAHSQQSLQLRPGVSRDGTLARQAGAQQGITAQDASSISQSVNIEATATAEMLEFRAALPQNLRTMRRWCPLV